MTEKRAWRSIQSELGEAHEGKVTKRQARGLASAWRERSHVGSWRRCSPRVFNPLGLIIARWHIAREPGPEQVPLAATLTTRCKSLRSFCLASLDMLQPSGVSAMEFKSPLSPPASFSISSGVTTKLKSGGNLEAASLHRVGTTDWAGGAFRNCDPLRADEKLRPR